LAGAEVEKGAEERWAAVLARRAAVMLGDVLVERVGGKAADSLDRVCAVLRLVCREEEMPTVLRSSRG